MCPIGIKQNKQSVITHSRQNADLFADQGCLIRVDYGVNSLDQMKQDQLW